MVKVRFINSVRKSAIIAGLTTGLMAGAQADVASDFMDRLEDESRPMEDRMRDSARRPAQVMDLLDVDEGMTVVDVGAGGGWYTRVLSAAVGQSGRVIAQFGPRGLQRENGEPSRRLAAGLGNTEAFFGAVDEIEDNVADRVVTALNIHHLNDDRGVGYMEDIYEILKPGGMAVIIDHEGSPSMNPGDLHRMLPSQARAWIEEAGFEIVEESQLLHTNADDHSMPVFAPELGRNTDRFVFLVRKPS